MSEFSGKFVLRIPQDLHKQLKQSAEQHQVSLNTWILNQIEQAPDHLEDTFLNLLAELRKHFYSDLIDV